jgi:NIMA (never in mitosis gene a)-related kinase
MNDFQIISKLGEGAYSTVYKVKRNIDNKIYALKKVKLLNLSQKEKENSLNEVRILASVKSNFVVSYKEAFFDEKDNTLCIVMEFADRGDLYQKIVQHKKSAKFFEESDIWRIFIQLVKGLKALHDLKILHRDMKSANVFLFSNGSAKLGDLNVSKVARKGLGYTQTGTPYYASPEVWKDKPYNNKSDVWSLGCVLYEMITLRPPFRAQDMEGLFNKVCKGQYSRIPERFSDDLFQIIQFLLQVNPNTRPSCEQILNHPVVQKRIEYFKSFAGEDETEDNYLLKTIHMPKNLLFLSDKLPKPNYDKQFKASINNGIEENNDNNYRSYNKLEIDKSDSVENKDYKGRMLIKKPVKLMPLLNIPEEKEKEKEKIDKGNDIIALNKENSKNNLIPNKNISSNNLIMNRGLKNSNKILLRKEEMYYLDVLSKQKNDLRKLMLKNSNLSRRLNYINNSQINPSSIKDLNKLLPNIINRSAPKKINNIKLLKKNGYMYNPSYIKNIEKYQKRTDKLDYDYGKMINQNIINNKDELKNGMSIKMPRRLIPLKIPFNKS